ncbi:MAG: 2,3-bisphosphoglycerate-independent phosphoglycerate mutase [Candidatus Caenarcaniphilales bacterium]|nr:2,3-bisphosphoglycerate-independent phosphoglycerate mutase [Candidatus Caenarcaniphilales bacterium]
MSEKKSKSVLLILDGWGVNTNPKESAISAVQPKFFNKLLNEFPNSQLEACGESVGLPEGVMGNSEVGHENIGAGRVAKQKLTLISEAIKNGSFFENKELLNLLKDLKKNKSKLHLIGLLSEGDVHSHLGHMYALIEWAEREQLDLFVHPILDGRDDPPKNSISLLEGLESKLNRGKIGSVCGRYWAMDRDNNWDRIEKYWRLLIKGEGLESKSPVNAVKEAYNRSEGLYEPQENSDEFVQPTKFSGIDSRITDGDGVIFFNFRPDRARQITTVLTQESFDGFNREIFPQIDYVCLTTYDRSLHEIEQGAKPVVPVAFTDSELPPQDRTMSLGEYVSSLNLRQLRIAETEKFRHVTSFFNQGREKPFEGEERILIPSPKVATYDMKPEMSLPDVAEKLTQAIKDDKYDLIVANFANADMVGHSGIFDAASEAIQHLDSAIEKVTNACLEMEVPLVITADHGNADQMVNEDGGVRTAHSLNPVPCILVSNKNKDVKMSNGALCDLAPTLLNLMNLDKPKQMSGKTLI